MKKVLIALTLLVTACSPQAAADNYVFEKRERDPTPSVSVKVVEYDTIQQLRAAIPEGNLKEGHELQAWGTINKAGTQCTIHVLRPERSYQPEWIGHEAAHCFWGRWHQ